VQLGQRAHKVYEVKWENAVHEVLPVSQVLKAQLVAKANQLKTVLPELLVTISKVLEVQKVNQVKIGLHQST
jgi:exosome complex RNA-binding protein Rrp4